MVQPTRILYVSGEVEPYIEGSDMAGLVRTLPERLQESGDYEVRIMMPRYGLIHERRNRLHEVIRLSGTDVSMGEETETLKVKVASIPGIRLQVYFMDNSRYFKRKGLHADKQGALFVDNAERALFFGRAVLETLRKLRWSPDVIHAFGWISGLIPMLLTTEFADDPLFVDTKVVYTPCGTDAQATLSHDLVESMDLRVNGEATGRSLPEIGLHFAHHTIFPPSLDPASGNAQFSGEVDDCILQALALYDQTLSDVLV